LQSVPVFNFINDGHRLQIGASGLMDLKRDAQTGRLCKLEKISQN
jgi:hypothetical protein